MKQLALFETAPTLKRVNIFLIPHPPEKDKAYKMQMLGQKYKASLPWLCGKILEEARTWTIKDTRMTVAIGSVRVEVRREMFFVGEHIYMLLTAEDMAETIEKYLK